MVDEVKEKETVVVKEGSRNNMVWTAVGVVVLVVLLMWIF